MGGLNFILKAFEVQIILYIMKNKRLRIFKNETNLRCTQSCLLVKSS